MLAFGCTIQIFVFLNQTVLFSGYCVCTLCCTRSLSPPDVGRSSDLVIYSFMRTLILWVRSADQFPPLL